jgi:hypothetical protein
VFFAVLALLPAACSDEEPEANGACEQGLPPEVPSEVDGRLRGSVVVLDQRDFTLDNEMKPRSNLQGRISASFADFSAVSTMPSLLMPLGDTCVGLVSRPVSMGQVVRIDLESLVIRGTKAIDMEPMRTSTGTYVSVTNALILDPNASVQITGDAGLNSFTSFDETLPAITPMEVTAPLRDGTPWLETSYLTIEWVPGDGDYVQVTVSPDMTMSTGGSVTCIVEDDGCFELPTSAATFLLAAQTPYYELNVARHRYRSVRLAEETTLELQVVSQQRLSLRNGENGQ